MPRVTLRAAEAADSNGSEDSLTEYMCDWPNCPNLAAHVLGGLRELRVVATVCDEHAYLLARSRA